MGGCKRWKRLTPAHSAHLNDPYIPLVTYLHHSSRSRSLLPAIGHLPLHVETQRAAEQREMVVDFVNRACVNHDRLWCVILVRIRRLCRGRLFDWRLRRRVTLFRVCRIYSYSRGVSFGRKGGGEACVLYISL